MTKYEKLQEHLKDISSTQMCWWNQLIPLARVMMLELKPTCGKSCYSGVYPKTTFPESTYILVV
jgi:hypothetical protein